MNKKPAGRKNPLAAAQRAERNRRILIQVVVAVALIALITGIGISLAVRKSTGKNDAAATSTSQSPYSGPAPANTSSNGGVRIGAADAEVTVRVVADLQCPACQMFETANGKVLEEAAHNGTAAVEYDIISFLDKASTNQYSSRAGNAAYCVAESDPSKYQAWLATMFAGQPREGGTGMSDEQLIQIARDAGYTDPAVGRCITDRTYEGFLRKVTTDVLAGGVQSTPSVFVNGTPIQSQQQLFMQNGMRSALEAATK